MEIKDEQVADHPAFFAGATLKPERQPGESFEDYRRRRALEKKAVKVYQTWGGREAVARHIEQQRHLDAERRARAEKYMALTRPSLSTYPAGLRQWHQQFPGSVRWRLTAEGLEVEGSGIPRTLGQPATMMRLVQAYGAEIELAASRHGVPAEILLATIATESGGDPDAVRQEPGYRSDSATPDRISAGLCQLLLSTAREVLRAPGLTRKDLKDPQLNILGAAAYIKSRRAKTQLDAPLVAAAYNAGGVYREEAPANPWRLRCYPKNTGAHITRWVRWYNDSWAVMGGGA